MTSFAPTGVPHHIMHIDTVYKIDCQPALRSSLYTLIYDRASGHRLSFEKDIRLLEFLGDGITHRFIIIDPKGQAAISVIFRRPFVK